ncbi:sugar kinase [Salimicrobium halophilum]|uniref:2-dehydro-3-deoxygluconokinase n=1 Tax=Salimicrobium halophilum TaxID=86666 RepID=A0A1G8S9S9_9BACI|nr:sugar kinase [Salimicrobium halophilum]SDJ25969.1 2-dehydro-3-deoxygluconokinase [Salimicrobium halophilum]
MKDVITIGEAMVVFNPVKTGPLKFVPSFDRNIGGAELNVMLGCSRLGLSTGWISSLGDDEFGTFIQNFARGEGVDVSEVKRTEDYPTSLNFKEIREDGSGKTFYYRSQTPTRALRKEELNEDYIKNSRVLHVTGIFPALHEGAKEYMKEAVAIAKQNGVTVALDPNIRLKLWSKEEARDTLKDFLPEVDILLSGKEEMELIFETKDEKEMFARAERFGIKDIIIKDGSNGASGRRGGDRHHEDSRPPQKVVDTVGAGDGFDAGYLYGYLQGWDLGKCLRFANTIGSMVVSVVGDNEGLPYLSEVQEALGEKEMIER